MGNKTLTLVAIVDDDQPVRESISSLLRSAGYKTAAFSSAESFLTSDHVKEPHCLVLDVVMPGLSGIELQTQLRARKCFTPIIFITARADDDHIRDVALGQGAKAFLGKPFNDDVLLDAIGSILK
ncbi:MAG TPA: response regulator [Candidatus Acidoferrum sp.]|nr:response regulator [Candidatus Acidoferrum sp.]